MTITTKELARLLGITIKRVSELGRLGKITREADGRWDLDKVTIALQQNLDYRQPTSGRTKPRPAELIEVSPRHGTQAYETWRLTREKAARAELERRELEGSLLDVKEVKTAWAGMISVARNRLLLVGEQISDTVAAESDPIRCREIIAGSIHDALTSLKEYGPESVAL
jgi:phage terminase Nu1 subunit (DNA packaging protein)